MNLSHRIYTASVALLVAILAFAVVRMSSELLDVFSYFRWSIRMGNPHLVEETIWYTLPYASIPIVLAVVGSLIAYFASARADQTRTVHFLLFWSAITAVAGFLVIALVGALWILPAMTTEVDERLLVDGWFIFLMLCFTVGTSTTLGMVCLIGSALVTSRRVAKMMKTRSKDTTVPIG